MNYDDSSALPNPPSNGPNQPNQSQQPNTPEPTERESIPMPKLPIREMIKGEPTKAGDDVTLAMLALEHVLRWLDKTDRKKDAAVHLGIVPRTITRMLQAYQRAYWKLPPGSGWKMLKRSPGKS